MRTPFAETLDDVDIGLIGVPFDGGVTNRTGARHGPREIRNQSSRMRRINQATKVAPYDLCRVCDVGDTPIRSPFHLESSLDEIEQAFARLHDAGVVPIAAGGDHSITLPVFRAIAKHRPVGMVHFDAHCDTHDDYLGSKFHHGAPFRRAVEEGLLDPHRTIQIGIRGGGERRRRVEVQSRQRDARGLHGGAVRARMAFGHRGGARGRQRRPTYVSFDVDGLDLVYAPGTGTPEVACAPARSCVEEMSSGRRTGSGG